MFDFFRKYNKIIMVFLFLLIIPSFVLFGVDRYNRATDRARRSPRVDGSDITRPEWDAQHRNEVDRIRQQAPNIEPALLDSDAARYATLERMVRDRVLAAAASKVEHDGVAKSASRACLPQDPGLASFRTRRRQVRPRDASCARRASTPEQYEASVRADLATQQVLLGVSGTALRHAGAGRRRAQRLLRPARSAGRALQAGRLRRRRSTSAMPISRPSTRTTPRSSRCPSRPASNTWCSTSKRPRRTSRSTRPTSGATTTRTPRASAPRKSAAPATS